MRPRTFWKSLRGPLAGFLAMLAGGPWVCLARDSSQPGHPEGLYGKRLAYHPVEGVGPCIAAEVVGNRLYAIGQGRLHLLDITAPEQPRLLGTLAGLGTTRQLVVQNQIAYITARQDGLWLVDVSNAAKPMLISHYDTVEMATGIWISGGLAFIATRCYGVEVVDVSDPRRVRHVSTLKTGEAQSCWARDGRLYIGDWAPRKLLVADVSCPRAPVLLAEAPLDGYGDGGCLRGKFCFAATGHNSRAPNKEDGAGRGHGLENEIGTDLRVTELGRLTIPNRGVKQVVAPAPGHFALLHCGGARIDIADVRDPARPRIVFSDAQVGLFYGDQLVDKLFAGRYLVAYWQRSGPAWYDISGAQPLLAGNTPDTTLYSWTDGACAYGDQLLITKRGKYSLLTPNETRSSSDLPTYGPSGVRVAGWPRVSDNRLALSQRHMRRVLVFDIGDIAQPRCQREYSLFGHPGACAFWNGRLVIPAGYQGLLLERAEAAQRSAPP